MRPCSTFESNEIEFASRLTKECLLTETVREKVLLFLSKFLYSNGLSIDVCSMKGCF